jgi:O-antigen/teichoic acid export membrane protein
VFGRAGRAGLNAFLGRVLLASLGLFLPYCLAVVAWPRLPLWLLYGNRYLHEGPGVALWAAVYLLMALRQVVSIGLGAMRRPDILMAASAVSAPVTVALAFLVSAEWGVAGALLARLAGELLCLGISTAGLFRRGVEQHPVVAGSDGRTPSSA